MRLKSNGLAKHILGCYLWTRNKSRSLSVSDICLYCPQAIFASIRRWRLSVPQTHSVSTFYPSKYSTTNNNKGNNCFFPSQKVQLCIKSKCGFKTLPFFLLQNWRIPRHWTNKGLLHLVWNVGIIRIIFLKCMIRLIFFYIRIKTNCQCCD